MSNSQNFSIRKFKNEDVDEILNLLNNVFKQKFTRDWWKWKYELNPSGFRGQDGDIWVAESEHKIVGHYALIPEKIKFYSRVIDIAQSVDTATHPDFRGKGVFTALAKKVYSAAKNRYPFLIGFPSAMAYRGFLNMGWKDLSPVPEHTKILDYNSFSNRKFSNPIYSQSAKTLLKTCYHLTQLPKSLKFSSIKGTNVEIEQIKKFSSEFDPFWDKSRMKYNIVMERTSAFLNWRFSKQFGSYQFFIARSTKENEILGYVVIKNSINSLDIIDLIALQDQDKAILELIDTAVRTCKDLGLDSIRCWFPKWHKSSNLLVNKGFISLKNLTFRKNVPKVIFYSFAQDIEIPKSNDWFFTYADTDYA